MKNKFFIFSGIIALILAFAGCQIEAQSNQKTETASLTSISVKTKPSKTTYTVGDTFSADGLVITAEYSDNSSVDVTYSSTSKITLSSPEMSSKGEKTVTVTYEGKSTSFKITVNEKGNSEEKSTYYEINAGTTSINHDWYIAAISLQDFAGKTIDITFSADMKVKNTGDAATLCWTINDADKKYPSVASKNFASGTTDWTTVTGSGTSINLSSYPVLYISTYGITPSNFTIYVKNIDVEVSISGGTTSTKLTEIKTETGITEVSVSSVDDDNQKTKIDENNWLSDSVPSLYETYKYYFDYFGFAVEYGNQTHTELYYKEIQNGLKKHANTISLGNEFKPDFVFNWGWWRESTANLSSFTASNGKTIKVPSKIPTFELQDEILKLCQSMNMHMRGHVLLWHSQTPDQFFYENYGLGGETTLVDAETMDARLEWYIKNVVQHCDKFTLSDGTPVIWAWDVANECTSDGSTSSAATSTTDSDWLRSSGSKWYSVYSQAKSDGDTNYYTGKTYESYDFVVNAFRFANKYANSTTKLVYNDYGGLSGTKTSNKHKSQLRLVQAILDHNSDSIMPTRIDAMGLQSHYSVQNSSSAYQTEIQDFIAKNLDVQITELDIATCANYDSETDTVGCSYKQFDSLADAYAGFMKMFIDNRKTDSKHGVTCVTIWGLSDQQTWLNTASQRIWIGNCDQYPLLFNLVNSGSSQTYKVYYNDGKNTATIPVSEKPDTTPSNVVGYYETFDDGDTYVTKSAFDSVINAAKNYTSN